MKQYKNTINTVHILPQTSHITKPTHTLTPTHYKTHSHPHITKPTHTHTHTLQNPLTPTHYKTHTYTHTHTHTHTLQSPHIHTPTHYKSHTCTYKHINTHPHILLGIMNLWSRNNQAQRLVLTRNVTRCKDNSCMTPRSRKWCVWCAQNDHQEQRGICKEVFGFYISHQMCLTVVHILICLQNLCLI